MDTLQLATALPFVLIIATLILVGEIRLREARRRRHLVDSRKLPQPPGRSDPAFAPRRLRPVRASRHRAARARGLGEPPTGTAA